MAADPLQLERDEVRFERLYREYAGDVYRYALAIMRNPADAEDVTQATFLNAWRAFSAGEEPREPLNWFITIAHNVCRLRFRTNSRRPKEVEFEPALAEAPVADGPSAGDVLDALAELPLNQRAALVMRELEGRSYGEIATVLGVSRSAVETLIFRARRSLRLRRDAIRTLSLLPLPQSLASFFHTRGAAEAGAAAVLGSGVAVKAVAVIAAGVVAAGVARDTVRAQATPTARVARPAQVEPLVSWAARPLSLLAGGRVVTAAPPRSEAAKSSAAPAVDRRATRRGGRLATIDEPEGAPGGSPAPTSPQPAPRAPSAGPPEPGGEVPRRTDSSPAPNRVPPGVPTLPAPPGPPGLPTIPPVSTPEVPLPDLPEVPLPPPVDLPKVPPPPPVDLPKVPPPPPVDLPKVPPPPPVDLPKIPPPPPVDPPDLPDLPDLPKLP